MDVQGVLTKAVDRLHVHSVRRSLFVTSIVARLPPAWIDNNYVLHVALVCVALIIIVTIFATIRRLTLFSLHPVCMVIGTVLCLGEGLTAYRNTFLLDVFSPIMQHDKTTKVRTIHQTLQYVGVGFIFIGFLFIVAHKIEYHHSILPSSLHSLLGFVCLALLIAQVLAGSMKLTELQYARKRVMRWHGDLGLLSWDFLIVTIVLGMIAFFQYWSIAIIFCVFPIIAWLIVVAQVQVKASYRDEDSIQGIDDVEGLISADGEHVEQIDEDFAADEEDEEIAAEE